MFDPRFGSIVPIRNLVGSLVCFGYLVPVLVLAVYGMRKTRQFGLLGLYLVVGLLIMVITIGKEGSGTNYTFEPLIASCCLASLIFRRTNYEDT